MLDKDKLIEKIEEIYQNIETLCDELQELRELLLKDD